MARRLRQLLTDRHVRAAKATKKPYRLADGGGLYLYVAPSGVKSWQYRYRHDGLPQTATLGKFSTKQGLAWARGAAETARNKASSGEHLTRAKAIAKATKRASSKNTFEVVAADWVAREARRAKWTPRYRAMVEASISNHLAPLNGLPVDSITAAMAMPHIRKVERSAPDMASKVRQRIRGIFDYAVEGGLLRGNPIPAARHRKGAADRTHLPAILDKEGVGAILRAADTGEACRGIRRAHMLAVFTAQRMGEICNAEWTEFDLEHGVWTIPRARMKVKKEERGPHSVPLSPQLLRTIKEWRRIEGDHAVYICPALRGDGAITREGVERFYRKGLKLEGKHSPHSWRAVLSTWANDAGEESDVVEAQLDHLTGSKIKVAYDRGKRLDRRADLMAWHEEALIAARDGAKVLPLRPKRVGMS
jgi:integrase